MNTTIPNASVSIEEQARRVAEEVAHGYLQTVKHWQTNDYYLEVPEAVKPEEVSMVVVDGIHKSDLQSEQRGGGQSVQLVIDVDSRRVLRELAYQ